MDWNKIDPHDKDSKSYSLTSWLKSIKKIARNRRTNSTDTWKPFKRLDSIELESDKSIRKKELFKFIEDHLENEDFIDSLKQALIDLKCCLRRIDLNRDLIIPRQ